MKNYYVVEFKFFSPWSSRSWDRNPDSEQRIPRFKTVEAAERYAKREGKKYFHITNYRIIEVTEKRAKGGKLEQ